MLGVSYKRKYYTQKARVKGHGKRRTVDRKEWEREDLSSGVRDCWKKRKTMSSLKGFRQRPMSLYPENPTLLKPRRLHLNVFREILKGHNIRWPKQSPRLYRKTMHLTE